MNAEIIVNMININYGKSDITAKSKILNGYSYFTHQVKEYKKKRFALDEAITKAMDDCIKQKMLEKFLKDNGSEIRNMLFTEFNLDDAKEVWFEEAVAIGEQRGKIDQLIKSGVKIPEEILKDINGTDKK